MRLLSNWQVVEVAVGVVEEDVVVVVVLEVVVGEVLEEVAAVEEEEEGEGVASNDINRASADKKQCFK